MAIFESTYSFNEVTAEPALKHGDTIKYNTGDLSTSGGWKRLTTAPAGTVLRSPKGKIVIREGGDNYSKVTTYYSHNGDNHTFETGTYTVLDVPKVKPTPEPDPVGDLAVKLALKKVNGARSATSTLWREKDVEWARKDKEFRALAEHVRGNYVAVGTSVILDSYGDLWFKGENGRYSLNHDAAAFTRDREYISREFGIKSTFTIG